MGQNTFCFKLPKSEIKPCLFGLQKDDVVLGATVHIVVEYRYLFFQKYPQRYCVMRPIDMIPVGQTALRGRQKRVGKTMKKIKKI